MWGVAFTTCVIFSFALRNHCFTLLVAENLSNGDVRLCKRATSWECYLRDPSAWYSPISIAFHPHLWNPWTFTICLFLFCHCTFQKHVCLQSRGARESLFWVFVCEGSECGGSAVGTRVKGKGLQSRSMTTRLALATRGIKAGAKGRRISDQTVWLWPRKMD